MKNALRIAFSLTQPGLGDAGLLPFLPVQLGYQSKTLETPALLDTGAMVNVLPYEVGLELTGCRLGKADNSGQAYRQSRKLTRQSAARRGDRRRV